MKKRYSSDISDRGWQVTKNLIPCQRQSKWNLREILNAIFYVTKNGCVWRDLPIHFPCWQTVYWYFIKWKKEGVWDAINNCLTINNRIFKDKEALPKVAIIDSQTTKNSATSTTNVGIDGGKKIKGRKRFHIVDTLGNLLTSFVVSANSYDGTTALEQWSNLSLNCELLNDIEKIYADGTFGGTFSAGMESKYGISVEIPKIPIAQKGKITIHQKRWIVERSIAWTLNNRRLSKDYERDKINSNTFITIANIRRLAK